MSKYSKNPTSISAIESIKESRNFINDCISSPSSKREAEYKNRTEYLKELRKWQENEITLTTKEIELLVLTIGEGTSTYQKLLSVVPRLNSATLCTYLINPPAPKEFAGMISSIGNLYDYNPKFFKLTSTSIDLIAPCEFKQSDAFALSIAGENTLYRLKKEQYMLELAEKSLSIAEESLEQSKKSTKYSKYATYTAMASIVTGILIAAIQFYLN